MKLIQLVTVSLLCVSGIAQASEAGTTIKTDTVRAAPFADAAVITTLPAAAKVDILKKDGGWMQIKSAQGSGWIRMLSIRRGDAKTSSAGSELSGLAGLASGRAGTGKVVSTTGIRGLNEEELKAAHYDEKQVTLADSYASSRVEAQKFATQAQLTAQQIDYLSEKSGGAIK